MCRCFDVLLGEYDIYRPLGLGLGVSHVDLVGVNRSDRIGSGVGSAINCSVGAACSTTGNTTRSVGKAGRRDHWNGRLAHLAESVSGTLAEDFDQWLDARRAWIRDRRRVCTGEKPSIAHAIAAETVEFGLHGLRYGVADKGWKRSATGNDYEAAIEALIDLTCRYAFTAMQAAANSAPAAVRFSSDAATRSIRSHRR